MEIPILNKKLDISVNIVHKEFADNFFKESGISSKPVIGISTTGGWETKRYKPDKYIKLINKLSLLYSVNFLLICGNEEERKECFYIHEKIKENTFVVPECGIRYLAALIEKCSIVIGNDSGPLHLAAAMNRPVLGIYGPTNPKLQGPFGDNNLTVVNETLNCLCCNLLKCPIGNICMTELHSDKIIIKIKELIQINKIAI
jgi:ADP-heptose:LPS heptosyltransferase